MNPNIDPNSKPNPSPTILPTPVVASPVAQAAADPVDLPDINMLTGKPIDPNKQRHFLAAFFLSYIFGVFGIDRFYLGKYWTGILKFLTFGGLGVWALIDLNVIMSGGMRDKQGNKLLQADRYRKFASRVTVISSLAVLAIVVLVSAVSIYLINSFFESGGLDSLIMGGTGLESLTKLMPGGSQTLNLDSLKNLNIGL